MPAASCAAWVPIAASPGCPTTAATPEKLCHVYLGRAGPRRGPPTEAGHRALWAPLGVAAAMLANPADAAYVAALAASGPPSTRPSP